MFWFSFRDWETEASFLAALADFLVALGRTRLVVAARREAHAPELFAPLAADLAECRCVLFLDDVHKPGEQMSILLAALVDAVRKSGTCKLVMVSRSVPQFFSSTEQGNLALEVSGLDRDSAWRMAQTLKAKDTLRVVEESHGHPLLLSLMARVGPSKAKGDAMAFVEREVYSSLTEQERSVLELLSVDRHHVLVEAVPGAGHDAIAGLRRRALVVEQEDGIWTHDLLREFFHAHMAGERKAELHRIAGEYCEGRPRVEWKLEALYHYCAAGDWASATRVALGNALELARDFPDEVLSLLSRIEQVPGAPRERSEVLFLKGQLDESRGHQEQALADYTGSLEAIGDADPERRALVLESVARVQSQVERWAESLAAHEKALRLYEKAGDREGQAREWMNVGGVHRRRGGFGNAREAYTKALTLATMGEDRPAQAACLNNLALLDWDEGRLRDSELRLKESVRLAHAVKDHSGEARGLENLAELLRVQGKLEEAANLLLESAEAFRRAGDIVDSKRVQAGCAETLGEQGRYSDGIDLCIRALERQELRSRKGLFQKDPRFDLGDVALSSVLVDLYRSAGNYRSARKELERYDTMSRSIGDQSIIAKGMLMSAMVSEDAGDLESASSQLGKAEELLRQAGNHEGLVAVHMRSGTVAEKRGDDSAAARHYEEAARHAEMAGNRAAWRLALDNLESLRGHGP
ncbi:MAG: hypothetical protein A3K67_03960 [Euryarchaeota archaeon RBG_16_62_10]|nr:MAG: hypothetical protein A3K67_03960 [Euryarchaeota archaeon RBG_16_62_10]